VYKQKYRRPELRSEKIRQFNGYPQRIDCTSKDNSMTPIRLLLVDDEQGFVEALTRRLVSRDYQAAYVLSGEDALRFLDKDKRVDVVLLDVKMPGLDGLETLRRIKALQPLVETIMLTGHATIATAVDAMRIGARDYLMKSCDFVELTAKVEAAARRKRDRESKIIDVRMRPYITGREKEELIVSILAS
jgi:two-component system, response regulator RegA